MKKRLIILFLSSFNFLLAQNNRWIDFYSYAQIKQTLIVDNELIAISENSFFNYNPENGEIDKFSSVNGLTGDEIARVFYSSSLQKLFIIYENAWIQIIDSQKNIVSIPDLYYNTFVSNAKKKCNAIVARQSVLYLAMDYGISQFDLEKDEFGDTYFIGPGGSQLQVNDLSIKDNTIYAATPAGLKKADLDDLLIDHNNWNDIQTGDWRFLENFTGQITGVKDNDLYKINADNTTGLIYHSTQPITGLKAFQNKLNLSMLYSLRIYNEALILIKNIGMPTGISNTFTTSIATDKLIYAGTNRSGILIFNYVNPDFEKILPDGPTYNDPFGIDAKDKHIWVVYGKHTTSFNPYPLLKRDVDHFDGTQWKNIPYNLIQARSLCYVKIHPQDPFTAYISSGHDGLIKIKNDTEITHYDETNSSLDYFVAAGDKNIRVFGLNFDPENNLFVTQTGSAQPVKILKNDGSWDELHFNQGFFDPNRYTEGIRSLSITDQYLWMGTVYKGVVGYRLDSGQYISIKKGIEPQSYPNVQSLDLDFNDKLWVGNHRMLRYMDQPENAFTDPAISFKPVKIEFEGSVQLLLEGQSVVRIKTDGNNDKWVATSGSGVYHISEDGKKVFHHFTVENSPLPSNEIYDLAIDSSSGIVYMATAKGLIGYRSGSFAPAADLDDVYAFPNPVIMQKHDEVTIKGLIKGVNVKIIDVEGNLVFEKKSKGGSITWDLTAFGHHKVSSGVYIALISNEDGTKIQTTKILIIR